MEFGEKLQRLRKSRGLTQEELAEAIYVSRTAISKWESGRGYPSIDSLKEISGFFSVTIDDLLSGEKLISIAEKENKSNMRGMCDLLLSIADLFSLMLIVLPLYPNAIDGQIYSVNLLQYSQISRLNLTVYWIMLASLVVLGAVKIILTKTRSEKISRIVTDVSFAVNIITVFFLAVSREAYAAAIAFFILITKGMILLKSILYSVKS